ncbi:MAG: VWA domain-containing protein [Pseudonocardiales bacterium]|nr:VWA domain-containing protein [Pseudonocardiales bacterium]
MALGGFSAPGWLGLLGLIAAVVVGYLWVQRRARRYLLRFANLELLERVAPRRPRWVRHIPAVLLILALLLLTLGLAGPTAKTRVPRNRATVMLVIDVSLSMNSTDVSPTRLAAAQDAAISFVQHLPPGLNLGVESFAGSATILVSPTTDRDQAVLAIRSLKLAESTATGDALAAALGAIDAVNQLIPGSDPGQGQAPPPARIVLMSDGKQNTGRDEFAVAAQAGAAHIPVSTISFGTLYGTVTIQGEELPVPVDDDSLAKVAQLSGGEFYHAGSNQQIHQVYDTLNQQIGYQTVRRDVSKPWFILGTLVCLATAATALLISQRLPA